MSEGRCGAGSAERRDRKAGVRHPFRREKRRPRVFAAYLAALALVLAARPTATGVGFGLLWITAGAALRVWATGHLHKNQELTISGPYAYLRHPLYAGALLIGIGLAIAAGPAVALVALPLGLGFFFSYYLPYKERVESARLEGLYGDAYRHYRDGVRSLVPRGRPWRGAAPPVRWRLARVVANNEHSVVVWSLLGLGVMAWRLAV
ncbi:MAG: isoprenylcysteine carboxylmethyltransferase family protein [Myxococcota bacterium]|nr:isoprenylcysteine carboxylmethyltransferase family protein [Myxococcota bacterium]